MTTTAPSIGLWSVDPREGHPLRHFLAWRKRHRIQGSFAYAQLEATLHRDLSTVDNCLLALGEPPSSASNSEKEAYVRKAMEREGLTPLLAWFGLGKNHVSSLTSQERAVAAICCALLSRADSTLIDLGRFTFDELCLVQVKQVLLRHAQRTIVIATQRPSDWSDLTPLCFETDDLLKKAA